MSAPWLWLWSCDLHWWMKSNQTWKCVTSKSKPQEASMSTLAFSYLCNYHEENLTSYPSDDNLRLRVSQLSQVKILIALTGSFQMQDKNKYCFLLLIFSVFFLCRGHKLVEDGYFDSQSAFFMCVMCANILIWFYFLSAGL